MPTRVLFVCLGNICRSPVAEAIFRKQVEEAGLAASFEIDSAGTGDWHVGQNADKRSLAVAEKHRIQMNHRARQITAEDFQHYDYVIGMDLANQRDLCAWPGAKPEKVSLMLSWDPSASRLEVPDPYYGDDDGFEKMVQMLVPACSGLLSKIKP